jgi:hypothetical protein
MGKKLVWLGIVVFIGMILFAFNVNAASSCTCDTGIGYVMAGINPCDVSYIPVCYGNTINSYDPYNPYPTYQQIDCTDYSSCTDCYCESDPYYVDPNAPIVINIPYGFRYYRDTLNSGIIDCWKDGGSCCGTNVDATYSSSSSDFSGFIDEFFDKYYYHDFSGTFTNSISFSTKNDDSCFGGRMDPGDKTGAFAYGYLYTLDDLTRTKYQLGSRATGSEGWFTNGVFSFINIIGKGISPSKEDIYNSPVSASCGGTVLRDDKDTTGMSFDYLSCDINLKKGNYFVAIGLVGTAASIDRNSNTIASELAIARFNMESDSAYTQNLNRINGNPKYIITRDPLTPTQLNYAFGNYMENTTWLCNLAGGQMLSDFNTAFTVDVFQTKTDFNISHFCCGDDGLSETYVYKSGEDNYYCSNGQWERNTLNTKCAALVAQAGYTPSGYVYESQVNTKPYAYDQIELGVLDGTDGCCGDDSLGKGINGLGDYGFISNIDSRKQYLCYFQDSAISPVFTWVNAMASDRYKIKTLNVSNKKIDVISNSKDWYQCDATKQTTSLNGFIISEGSTFASANYDDSYACSDICFAYYSTIFEDKCIFDVTGKATSNCYEPLANTPITVTNPRDCDGNCYLSGTTQGTNIISIIPQEPIIKEETTKFTTGCVRENVDSCDDSSLNSEESEVTIISSSLLSSVELANKIIFNNYFVSNNSFLCFKQQGENIISECCYNSSCHNNLYSTKNTLSAFNNRVLTTGSTIHTIENFDYFIPELGKNSVKLSEAYKVLNINNGVSNKPAIYTFSNPINISGFSYLEFDTRITSENVTLAINNIDLGKLMYYSNNGVKSKIVSYKYALWHHIIIDLTDSRFNNLNSISTLSFSENSNINNPIYLDNIILTPYGDADFAINTKSQYCSGGYGEWLSDLDPLDTDITTDKTNQNTLLSSPHKLACLGVPSYDWTGTQCCGDDTRINNVKEYFNDTNAGCFAGSKINNSRVADSKGYLESTNKSKDELDSYEYKDILYNVSFIGCQMNTDNLTELQITYDGLIKKNNLINTNFKTQCGVIGNYYCKDGAWRQKIDIYSKPSDLINGFDTNFTLYTTFTNLTLKTAPSGIELIKNGFKTI